jgi:anaphase-promoting complex subunit 11
MSSGTSRKRRSSDTTMVDSNNNNNNNNEKAGSAPDADVDDTTGTGTGTGTAKVQTTLKVHIQRVHGVAQWSWNANDDVCGICQSAFEGTAPGVNLPGDHSPVVWGRCLHAFHLQCVSKWLQSANSKNSCPICRQEWEFGENPVSKNDTAVPGAVTAGAVTAGAAAIAAIDATASGGD